MVGVPLPGEQGEGEEPHLHFLYHLVGQGAAAGAVEVEVEQDRSNLIRTQVAVVDQSAGSWDSCIHRSNSHCTAVTVAG